MPQDVLILQPRNIGENFLMQVATKLQTFRRYIPRRFLEQKTATHLANFSSVNSDGKTTSTVLLM
jgi:hypothetical protein